MKKIFKARVEKGKLVFDDEKSFSLIVWSLNGKEVSVTVAKPTRPRSGQQNRYYHGVVVPILSENCGYSNEEMHDALRMKFLCDNVACTLPRIKSTTELTTFEFEDYMSRIRIWASADLGCYVPVPNECEY